MAEQEMPDGAVAEVHNGDQLLGWLIGGGALVFIDVPELLADGSMHIQHAQLLAPFAGQRVALVPYVQAEEASDD